MFRQKIKLLVLTLVMLSTGIVTFSPMSVPVAAASGFSSDACAGVNALSSDTPSGTCASDSGKSLNNIIKLVLNILSLIVGVTAVIMVMVGGFKYITSNGDSGNTAGARNTIVYAVVGLVIVAVAQVLVHYVLAKTAKSVG